MASFESSPDIAVNASTKLKAVPSIEEVRRTPSIDASMAEEIRGLLSNSNVLTPESEGYADSLKRWAESAEKPAGLVVLAETAQDISQTVKFCRQHKLDLAVCGGGHSTGGMSSSDGGVVVDLSKMRNVVVDATAKTITAQGGAHWVHVDTAAEEEGLATVGGTVNHTGIGGLTLGGGFGWLTGKYGLAIDNLVSVEVVLANGDVVQASETVNTDLFWAIRGAGANFGVTTSFTYRAHKQRNPIFAGILAFMPDKLESVVSFLNDMILSSTGEKAGMLVIGCAPPHFQPAIITTLFYNGTEEDGRAAFAPLYALNPVMDQTGVLPYSSLNGMSNLFATHGDRKTAKSGSFATPVRPGFVREVFIQYQKFVTDVPDAATTVVLMDFIKRDKAAEVLETSMAYANRGNHQAFGVDPRWTDVKNDESIRAWARGMVNQCKEEAKNNGTELSVYGNLYQDLPAAEIFGVNFERLRELKSKYDPGNLFNKLHPIPPL